MTDPKKCPQCKGSGSVTIDSPNMGPVNVMCGVCKGTGFIVIKEQEESGELLLLD